MRTVMAGAGAAVLLVALVTGVVTGTVAGDGGRPAPGRVHLGERTPAPAAPTARVGTTTVPTATVATGPVAVGQAPDEHEEVEQDVDERHLDDFAGGGDRGRDPDDRVGRGGDG